MQNPASMGRALKLVPFDLLPGGTDRQLAFGHTVERDVVR
jgi:hypothetical protein